MKENSVDERYFKIWKNFRDGIFTVDNEFVTSMRGNLELTDQIVDEHNHYLDQVAKEQINPFGGIWEKFSSYWLNYLYLKFGLLRAFKYFKYFYVDSTLQDCKNYVENQGVQYERKFKIC